MYLENFKQGNYFSTSFSFFFQKMPSILSDDRFKIMFENPDFQVDEKSEEFRLLNPLVSKISEKRKKKLKMLEYHETLGEVKSEIF